MNQKSDSTDLHFEDFLNLECETQFKNMPFHMIKLIQRLRVENKFIEADSIIKEWFL